MRGGCIVFYFYFVLHLTWSFSILLKNKSWNRYHGRPGFQDEAEARNQGRQYDMTPVA